MNWKDILKSKKYEDMTDEEQAKIDRRIAEATEKERKEMEEYNAKFADEIDAAQDKKISRRIASDPKYFAQREMASIAGVEFPEGKKKKKEKNS